MPTSFTFYLDWIVCAQFAGLCWAKAKGLYTSAGLDVTLLPWQEDGRTIVEKVMAGGVCAGSSEDNLVVSAAAKYGNVKVIGAMLQETPLVLMSRPAQRIRSIQDLRGKRIGIHSDGNRAFEMVLALEGIAQSDIEVHEVTFDLEHLRQNRFDALQGYLMTEPIQLAALGIEVDVLPISHPRLHPYAQVFFASTQTIASERDVLARFLIASLEGWRAVLTHADESAHIIAQMMGDPTQVQEQRRMLDRLLPLVAGSLPIHQIGTLITEQWQRNLETYFQFGLVDKPLGLTDVLDATLLPGML